MNDSQNRDIEKRARALEMLAKRYDQAGKIRDARDIRADHLDTEEGIAVDTIIAALTTPDGWVRAVDRELVTAEIGVANPDDSFEVASQKLHELIMWHVKVATDPAVNGGFVLVPVDAVKKCACGCHRYCCVHCGTELGGVDPARPEAP